MNYEIVEGERKGSSFVYLTNDKYLFRQKSKSGDIRYFECFDDICDARIKIQPDNLCSYVRQIEHYHDTHHEIFLKWKLLNEIKDKVRTSTRTCKEIFDDICEKIEYRGVARQLQFGSLKATLHRIRKSEAPENPHQAANVEAIFDDPATFERFGKSLGVNPEPFYRGTITIGEKVGVIFGSGDIIRNLNQTNRRYYIDGTFSIVPQQFYQLLIVGVEYEKHMFPIFYALMTHKSQDLYTAIFEYIEANICNLNPQSFMSDYEVAIRSSISRVYNLPVASVNGCFFHYAQALRKRASKTPNMIREMKTNPEAKKVFKKFIALALLPSDKIADGFAIIQIEARNIGFSENFLEYYESFWINRVSNHLITLNVSSFFALNNFFLYRQHLLDF